MPAEILSLDMDWFNMFKNAELKDGIHDFFAQIKSKCVLPKSIDLVPEHQYLYPWSVKLLDGLSYRKMNVVNIDEHHDFYCLEDINDFDDEKSIVGCWNFFAYMAHQQLLGKYSWVTNRTDKDGAEQESKGLFRSLRLANSKKVRAYKNRFEIVDATKLLDVVRGRKFDGFIIVRSPLYTERRRSVYHTVDAALKAELPKCQVRRYKCRVKFRKEQVRHRANSLFWQL